MKRVCWLIEMKIVLRGEERRERRETEGRGMLVCEVVLTEKGKKADV